VSAVAERLLVLIILLVVVGIPAGITWSKGHRIAFVLGFLLIGLIWIVAACRLARPSSWWARRFYGPEKMKRASERFESGVLTS
jgi:protein-S-isoprenylcysteine O-methyltransferase Ste14